MTTRDGSTAAHEIEVLDAATSNFGDVRDPYAGYADMRRRAAIHCEDHLGMKVFRAYRFDEAQQILQDDVRFSAAINGKIMEPFLGRTILSMDGHEHQSTRGLIGHAFRPRAVAAWEQDLIRPTAHELIDRFAARGSADLVREFTWLFPVRVFAKILGLPAVDYARWGRWAIDLERISVDLERGVQAVAEVKEYFEPIIRQRRDEPSGDLVSDLASAEVDGHRLDDEYIHAFLRLLVPAGASTTYRLTGSLLFALLRDRAQMEAVRADRSLLPSAIEETLRWEAPVQFAVREAREDVEVGGVLIPEGSVAGAVIGSANHDESRWEEPERFDLFRDPEGNLANMAFGGGPHYCLGAHLARLEARIALDVILDRVEDLALDASAPDPYVVGWAFRSPTALPVTFRAV